jgi:Arc/MetJ-type ribon-helix-helix transcriptional regulator
MTVTVRLDSNLENILNSITNKYHKKKSDVIREAIVLYSESIKNKKKDRFDNAVNKVAFMENLEMKEFEETNSDGL